MGDLEGKIAVVLGAGTVGEEIGNGRATALLMAQHGATVICVDRDEGLAERTAEMASRNGGRAESFAIDATDEGQVRDLIAEVVDKYGRIDVLDNNIGIAVVGGVTQLSESDWDRVIATNLKTAINGMKYVIPAMLEQGSGSIINVSSLAAIRWSGVPYAAYYSTKAALSHLSRTTAVEHAAAGIRVNSVLPGLIKTPMVANTTGMTNAYGSSDVDSMWEERSKQVPMKRMGEPWDVAEAVVFLASDRSKFVNGVDLVVDGGMSVKVN
jgi:NAD(P)-dependent dehydrogenase (short-subunit alcohol dehydrogenase family)